jgi:protein toll
MNGIELTETIFVVSVSRFVPMLPRKLVGLFAHLLVALVMDVTRTPVQAMTPILPRLTTQSPDPTTTTPSPTWLASATAVFPMLNSILQLKPAPILTLPTTQSPDPTTSTPAPTSATKTETPQNLIHQGLGDPYQLQNTSQNTACKPNCTFLSRYLHNSFFQNSNGTELAHYVWNTECSLDVKELIGNIPKYALAELTVIIACTFPARVKILNAGEIRRKNLVSYLDIRQCVVDWRDAINFGKAVDFRVMNILWPVSFSHEEDISPNDIIPGNYTNDAVVLPRFQKQKRRRRSAGLQMIKGLHNIGSIMMLNPPPCSRPDKSLVCSLKRFERKQVNHGLPGIFSKYLWPRMAEVIFSDLDLDDATISQLKDTMPFLQSLEIINNRKQFKTLPAFPWYQWRMRLPRRIARTTAGNSHYTGRMDIEPNVYRRVFSLDRSPIPISGLRLQGLLDDVNIKKSLIYNGSFTELGDVLFKKTKGLQQADLSQNNIPALPKNFFYANAGSLKELNLDYNNLTKIPFYMFDKMIHLEKLSLAHNKIEEVSNQAFMATADIEEIILSYNDLEKVRKDTFYRLSKLKILKLDHNEIEVIELEAMPSQNSNELATLDLNHNKLQVLHSQLILFRFAEYIDLSHNGITSGNLSRLLTDTDYNTIIYVLNYSNSDNEVKVEPYGGRRKILSLVNNNIEHIYLDRKNASQLQNFHSLLTFFNIDLSGNPLNCDCRAFALHEFLVGRRVNGTSKSLPWLDYAQQKWLCAQPKGLETVPLENVPGSQFLCEYNPVDCPSDCACFRRMTDDVTVVDCNKRNLTTIPERMPKGMLELYFNDNQIVCIPARMYLKYVVGLWMARNDIVSISHEVVQLLARNAKRIDLRYNKIARVSESVMTLWENMEHVDLMYNLIVCDCHSKWLQMWIRNAQYLVNRWELRCASDDTQGGARGSEIWQVQAHEFVCKKEDQIAKIIASILGACFILLIISAILIFRYRQDIKIWLYAKYDWHPFDKVDDSDPSLIYDAYVCYSSLDFDWVVNTLRSKLEDEITPPYELMLHQRSFIPGNVVMDSIFEGVNKSKRMIMHVTQNFIRSEWCMVEFRTAHHEVLVKNTRNYIIAILDEDFDIESVPEDLNVFLKNTTYLKKNEPLFWDKLFYALPQKGPRQSVPQRSQEGVDPADDAGGRRSVISNGSIRRSELTRQTSAQSRIGNGSLQPKVAVITNGSDLSTIRDGSWSAPRVSDDITNGHCDSLQLATFPPTDKCEEVREEETDPVSDSGVLLKYL